MLQTFESFEVIVVDNGSTDGSAEYVTSNFPSVRVIENGRNLGFAAGNNVGMKASHGRYVVLLNNDTRVSKDLLESLVHVAQADGRIGSVGCGIVQEDRSVKYGPVFLTRSGVILGIGEVIQPQNNKNHLIECLANCGCAVLYSKSALDHVGLFDEDFWSDWEDHDLGYRLALAGYRNVFIPVSNVLHKGGGGFGSPYSLQRTIRVTRNSLATYFKNFEAKNILLKFLPIFLLIIPLKGALNPVLYEFSILGFRFSRRKVDGGEIRTLRRSYGGWVRGYVAFLRIMPFLARKRSEVQGTRKTADSRIREAQQVKIARPVRPPAV